MVTNQVDEDKATRCRHELADWLRDQGYVTDPRIDEAFRTVPRHLFLPDTPLEQAYANTRVYTKHAGQTAISAASQPNTIAMQLHQLAVQPGQRIREVGAATGYNAALLAYLVGNTGQVVSLDVDADLVRSARAHLDAAGITNVEVRCQDGALGDPDNTLYDRIVATVGIANLPDAWRDQLAPDGRLVAPLRIAGSAMRSVAFERAGDRWESVDSEWCAFMPLRDSVCADRRRTVELAHESEVILHAYPEQDVQAAAVCGVLAQPAYDVWTGIEFGDNEPLDPVWLWLACALPNAVSRMEIQRNAQETGLVSPMLRWGSMATVEGDSLAYLTMRRGKTGHEMGVIGHGPARRELADRMAAQVAAWAEHRDSPISIAVHPSGIDRPSRTAGVFTLERSNVTVTWRS
ncbi:methyltransferase, FxLD system [Saccharopolyspora griseoalba]|uniref:Protein-L-isoaspartate O-methyltransferase n=1 Tax=Saccharopolyspora griseoalba TaxID=1431848 RepID=A0ABW2LT94_9PSEU